MRFLINSTDTGSFNDDNITKVVRPVVKLTSEKDLNTSDIFLDISDGKGTSKFNKGTYSNVFSVGSEQNIIVNDIATDQSIYPITFQNIDLPDNNYGFLWLILSGNKSPEALKVTFNSVDEYGHEVSISENG